MNLTRTQSELLHVLREGGFSLLDAESMGGKPLWWVVGGRWMPTERTVRPLIDAGLIVRKPGTATEWVAKASR
jgi:hypothetical protein